MAKYLQRSKSLADQLATSGSPVSDGDLQACVFDGLSSAYHPFTSSIKARARILPLSTEELYSLVICEDMSISKD